MSTYPLEPVMNARDAAPSSAARVRALGALFVVAIYGVPAALVAVPGLLVPSTAVWLATALAGPVVYAAGMMVTAGLLARPFVGGIVPGRFERSLDDPTYRKRYFYGLCWTTLYYCKPAYSVCLAIPALRTAMFRLFGYRGQMDFVIYPDTWIRDLPLLDFGRGAYIANRATLGTNMALSNGKSLVDRITIGDGATVGHLAAVALGTRIGNGAEIGVGTAVGVGVRIGANALVNGTSTVNHYARVADDVVVDTSSYVGLRATVTHDLPARGEVHARTRVRSAG